MYYQKESKSIPNDYYKTYSENLKKETNDVDMLSIIIKILTIVFLLTLIIFGYIFISNQYYLASLSNQTEVSKEHMVETQQEGDKIAIKSIESVVNSVHQNGREATAKGEKLSSKDMSKIVQMVMLKMNTINEEEKLVEKSKPHTTPIPPQDSSNSKVVIREVDTSSTKIRFIVVQKGDTLSTIAYNVYGDRNSYKKIRDANRDIIKDTNKIFAGQRLRIPI